MRDGTRAIGDAAIETGARRVDVATHTNGVAMMVLPAAAMRATTTDRETCVR